MSDIEKNDPIDIATEETAEPVAGDDEAKDKKPVDEFKSGGKKKLENELKAVMAEREDYKDKYLRTLAEFNNYKKRTAGTRSEALKDGQCEAIGQILPVLDNLERALEHIEADKDNPMAQGVAMVHKLLADTLGKLGIEEIPALGEPFDPTKHQAVQMVEAAEGETPGNVGAVVQKGYMADDRVIRHSMVIVNK
jgi:molecular chaperone GrpE